VAAGPRVPRLGERSGMELIQVGPTVCDLLSLEQNPGTEMGPLW
jgi:hypothetical protein